MSRLSGIIGRVRFRLHAEGGFTLIEVMMAVGVMAVTLLAMAYTSTIAFSDIGFARQRQGATGLANQAIEQARALPFDTLKKGLSSNDSTIASDPNITACGINKCFGGEQIPLSGYSAATVITPLVPHRTTIVIGPTTFTVSVYVTYYNNQTTANNTFRLTSIVTWANPQRRGVLAKVTTQTVAFSPAGCLSTATHPFAAPCQPFLYSTASADEGHVDVSGTLEGVSLDHASVWVQGFQSNLQIEQISAVSGTAQTSGASTQLLGDDENSLGRVSIASGADNDPAQSDLGYQTLTGPIQGSQSRSESGSGNTVTVTSSNGDTTASTSAVTASVSPANLCPNVFGYTNETDNAPCGSSTTQQKGTSSLTVTLRSGVGTATLATVGAASSLDVATTNRELISGQDGKVRANVTRYLGTIDIGGLPDGLVPGKLPTGWNGYLVRLSGYTDSVQSEAGTSSTAPTVSRSGTISYWNGAGYTSCAIAACPATLPIPAVAVIDNTGGNTKTVNMVASVTVGITSTTQTFQTCSPACPNTRTSGKATSNSPLNGDIFYVAAFNGTTLADFDIKPNLGALLASTSYQVAPSAT
jgi:type II secretory pathway pseudopilin PulG